MRLLQVCNVGSITGGTAACAWTIARALPWADHTVAFLSSISDDTRDAFAPVNVERWDRVEASAVARVRPDVVLLHNTPRDRCDVRLPAVTIQYAHSKANHAPADRTAYCSRWLADQCGQSDGRVLHQPVPVPPDPDFAAPECLRHQSSAANLPNPDDVGGSWSRQARSAVNHGTHGSHGKTRGNAISQVSAASGPSGFFPCIPCVPWLSPALVAAPPRGTHPTRTLREHILVGRLCTPTPRKWPADLPAFYAPLATRFPTIEWEFVGCPMSLQPALQDACGGRAQFLDAGWSARSHLHRWDALLYHHPALTESFGRTCAEALRAGCIPVVDNRGGFREQLLSADHDTLPGYLCDTPADFAAALKRLHHPATRRAMSRAAKAHGDERFSLHRFATNFHGLLSDSTRAASLAREPEAPARASPSRR